MLLQCGALFALVTTGPLLDAAARTFTALYFILYVCISISLSLSLSIYIYIYTYMYIRMYTSLSLYTYIYIYIYTYIHIGALLPHPGGQVASEQAI